MSTSGVEATVTTISSTDLTIKFNDSEIMSIYLSEAK